MSEAEPQERSTGRGDRGNRAHEKLGDAYRDRAKQRFCLVFVCFLFYLVFGGPGGGFGGPGGGFLVSSKSCGKATTETIKKKATTRTTKTTPRATEHKTKRKTPWLVYLQFRGAREKLQGGFGDLFTLFFG